MSQPSISTWLRKQMYMENTDQVYRIRHGARSCLELEGGHGGWRRSKYIVYVFEIFREYIQILSKMLFKHRQDRSIQSAKFRRQEF